MELLTAQVVYRVSNLSPIQMTSEGNIQTLTSGKADCLVKQQTDPAG